MKLYDNPNIYSSKVEGNTDTIKIITAETTFVLKNNSWLACVAGACPILSCAVTSKRLLRRLTVGNHCQLKYFIQSSTKFGTMIVYDIENSTGYGPHRDLSNNSKYSRFNFLHQAPSMETRLPQAIPN